MSTLKKKKAVKDLYRSHPKPDCEITFLMQDWEDGYNVGGMFRVADACGAKTLFSSGRTPQLDNPMIGVTSLGHHRRIELTHIPKNEDAADHIQSLGYELVVLEISENAVSYQEFSFPAKVCFILGNEERGVYHGVLKKAEQVIYIPQFGKGRSMNVHVSAAVVAFEMLRQWESR